MFMSNKKLTQNVKLTSRLMAMVEGVVQNARHENHHPAVRAAQSIHSCNSLGPIVFATPELGRWSTVGGLGVMIDELSIGLAALGQDIIVISPYYEKNRKGKTGYLAEDPTANIRFKDNITVEYGERVTLGVHEGNERGVRVVFLHNPDKFPSPYPDSGAGHTVSALGAFNKGVLEWCCSRKVIPSVMVTNDWFTGLIAGYAKAGHFGETFNSSKFLHICHNLQETYEGRIHPHNHEGDLNRVHQLPRDWFSDHGNMINPSKCALLQSDHWSTVSKSYKQELLEGSSLRHILHNKPDGFAYPNGIPIKDRIKRMDAVAPDHMTAKRML